MSWQTRFCLQFPCSKPIMGAPMAGVSGGKLAAATCQAGALGSIAAGHFNTSDAARNLAGEIKEFRSRAPNAPLCVGFICHSTFRDEKGWQLVEEFLSEHRPDVVQFTMPAVVCRTGNTYSNIDLAKKYGSKVIVQVGTETHARAALEAGTDAVVAQGTEAGGHGCRSDIGSGTLPLAARIVSVVRSNMEWKDIPVLAAGGIVDGRGLAATLALGCDGCVLGTRLWASHEAKGRALHKERLVRTNTPDDVVRNQVMDTIQNSYSSNPWPEPFDSSGLLRNPTIEKWHGHQKELKETLETDSSIAESFKIDNGDDGDCKNAFVYAGKGVADVSSIDKAYDIVCRVDDECKEIINCNLAQLVK